MDDDTADRTWKPERQAPDPASPDRGAALRRFTWILIGVVWIAIALHQMLVTGQQKTLAYSEFKTALRQGQVISVVLSSTEVHGSMKAPPAKEQARPAPASKPAAGGKPAGPGRPRLVTFQVHRVDDPGLLKDLEDHRVRVSGRPPAFAWRELLGWVLPVGLVLLVLYAVLRARAPGLGTVGQSRARVYAEHDIDVRFSDVAGVDEAKEELREVIDFLQRPGRYTRLGGKLPRGILLVGPPGTGKTLLARAVAGEAGVPFFSISGSEFVEMFVGVGAARVRDLFSQARQKAPCIIFVDELDALGKVRSVGGLAHEEREQTLNQLLVEMDGFDPRSGVILMAATNRPEVLDPALLRAGRFDRQILVDRPDRAGRLAILQVHARKIALENPADLEVLAGLTAGMAGADLANLLNEAALLATRHERPVVGMAELTEAFERVVAGLEKKSKVLTSEERERVACHEIGHALAALHLQGVAPRKVSIIPRGVSALGYTLQTPAADRSLLTQRELEERIATLLAGREAEAVILGEVSTGARDDLMRATELASTMVRQHGMSPLLGPQSFEPREAPWPGLAVESGPGAPSPETAQLIDQEIHRIIEEQRARVHDLIERHKDELSHASGILLQRETLEGDDLVRLLHPGAPAPDSVKRGSEACTLEA